MTPDGTFLLACLIIYRLKSTLVQSVMCDVMGVVENLSQLKTLIANDGRMGSS